MNISPTARRIVFWAVAIIAALLILLGSYWGRASFVEVAKFKATLTAVIATLAQPTATPTLPIPTATATVIGTSTATPQPLASDTATPTLSPAPAATFTPWPAAPACPDLGAAHDNSVFHTLWDGVRGCHYDHEHGTDPFTAEVAAAFPGFDLLSLLGGVGVGHSNPSGPTENTNKHGGFKWNVQLHHPQTCAGFESAPIGVDGSVIQIHGFGDYSVELEAPIHSAVVLHRQCKASNPTDYGFVFTVQHVSYGEVASPYQGDLLHYPYYSVPDYDPAFGMYLTVPCIGQKLAGQRGACRETLAEAQTNVSASNWASKPTGCGQSCSSARPPNSSLLRLLWRVQDTPQMFDWADQTYPYSFLWLCTSDGGATYNPVACRYTNSTTQVHEMAGEVPAAWDNLTGFDTDSRVGRVTGEGFTTAFGELVSQEFCQMPGMGCHPVKLMQAFVGKYGSVLVFTGDKGTNVVPFNPSRNIFFCGQTQCAEGAPGAVPSGWIGAGN